MAVEVETVRIALGGMTEGEIPSNSIAMKIRDAELLANDIGGTDGEIRDNFIRDYAAWRSFLISRTYRAVSIGDIKVQQDVELKADALKRQSEDSLENWVGSTGLTVSTSMWDERLEDPYAAGEDEDTTIIVLP